MNYYDNSKQDEYPSPDGKSLVYIQSKFKIVCRNVSTRR